MNLRITGTHEDDLSFIELMYIENAVLTEFCLWFTDRSCFGWTRPSASVQFSSERSFCASHPVGPMCPGTLSRSFHTYRGIPN